MLSIYLLYLLAICTFSLENCLLGSFAHFLNQVICGIFLVFFFPHWVLWVVYWIKTIYIYIYIYIWTHLLLVMWSANIFCQSVGYLFILLMISFLVLLCSVTHSCSALCDPMDWSPPGSSVMIIQARILERVGTSSFKQSSQPRDQTHVTCIGRQVIYRWATWEAFL